MIPLPNQGQDPWYDDLVASFAYIDGNFSTIGHTHVQADSHLSPDTDASAASLHHTLGTGASQAAAGNHTHTQAQSHNSPDTDSATTALHHTLGTGAFQAAAGNHSHSTVANHASTHLIGGSDDIGSFGSANSGLVPASGGGTTNFLRADGSWAVPPGTGGGGGSGTNLSYVNVKTDYGAAGDAKPFTASITNGSNVVTSSGLSFTAADIGKTIVVEGAKGTNVPLVATITARTTTTATLSASATVTVSSGQGWCGTNDTAAFTGARDAVINGAVLYPNGDRICQQAMYIPPGYYIITSQDALLNSVKPAVQLRNFMITGGWGARGTQLIFATSVTSTTDRTAGNLITAGNRLRGAKFQFFTVRSCNKNQNFAFLFCDTSSTSLYGSGAQNDIVWDTVNLKGFWNRGWGLDGDANTNLNSEQVWTRCYVDDSTEFQQAIVTAGISLTGGGDQMVNYIFDHCYFEFNQGDALRFNWGGHIKIYGGSWIMGVNGGSGDMISFPANSHQFYTKNLVVDGTRFEMRNASCRVLNSTWSGSSNHVTFRNITSVSNSSGDSEHFLITQSGTSHGFYLFQNCEIGGYVNYSAGAAATLGRITFDMCNFNDNNATAGTTTSDGLRYTSTFAPKYRFRDCYNAADSSN